MTARVSIPLIAFALLWCAVELAFVFRPSVQARNPDAKLNEIERRMMWDRLDALTTCVVGLQYREIQRELSKLSAGDSATSTPVEAVIDRVPMPTEADK